jgi:hypothetical protein
MLGKPGGKSKKKATNQVQSCRKKLVKKNTDKSEEMLTLARLLRYLSKVRNNNKAK